MIIRIIHRTYGYIYIYIYVNHHVTYVTNIRWSRRQFRDRLKGFGDDLVKIGRLNVLPLNRENETHAFHHWNERTMRAHASLNRDNETLAFHHWNERTVRAFHHWIEIMKCAHASLNRESETHAFHLKREVGYPLNFENVTESVN